MLAANMETAVNAVWDARPGPGDRIVVFGAGVVGSLVAWLCDRIPGTSVLLVDPDATRTPVVEALGVDFATEPPANRELGKEFCLVDGSVSGEEVGALRSP